MGTATQAGLVRFGARPDGSVFFPMADLPAPFFKWTDCAAIQRPLATKDSSVNAGTDEMNLFTIAILQRSLSTLGTTVKVSILPTV